MGRYLALLLALIAGSWIAFVDQKLPESAPISTPATQFSAERAFQDVNFLAAVPHPVGSVANANVRDAIVGQMLRLGLSPEVRAGVGVQQPKWAKDLIVAGRVENIVGVLPGRDRRAPAVALMAHYDSVPGSPGAADDIMGVATALETIRAIKARGTPARDVMLVITDGEEAGLLGANHFFRRDPLALRIGLVINIEARGSGGRALMFQTSPKNGELIDLVQRTAKRPSSSSLSVLLYEQLPNDTDLTETLKAGHRPGSTTPSSATSSTTTAPPPRRPTWTAARCRTWGPRCWAPRAKSPSRPGCRSRHPPRSTPTPSATRWSPIRLVRLGADRRHRRAADAGGALGAARG